MTGITACSFTSPADKQEAAVYKFASKYQNLPIHLALFNPQVDQPYYACRNFISPLWCIP